LPGFDGDFPIDFCLTFTGVVVMVELGTSGFNQISQFIACIV